MSRLYAMGAAMSLVGAVFGVVLALESSTYTWYLAWLVSAVLSLGQGLQWAIKAFKLTNP